MSQNHRYREQIDACRPGTGDLSLPALVELAQAVKSDRAVADEVARSERFDYAVSAAMHDVPLPAGLLQRLEAKLADADTSAEPDSAADVSFPPTPAGKRRRTWLAIAGLATAAAILLAVGVQLWLPAPREISQDQLTALASQWVEENAPHSSTWSKPAQPMPQVLARRVTSVAQRTFTTANGERAIVYDISPNPRQRVLLFVVSTPHTYDVRTAPFTRLKNASGGMSLAAWQTPGTLYVLAVHEVGQSLEGFIRQQRYALRLPAARPA